MNRETIIEKLALENAMKFKGKANPKALIGGVMRQDPNAKSDMANLQTQIATVTEKVNSMSIEAQKARMAELDPDFEAKKQHEKSVRKEKRSSLPELSNAVQGKVFTRMAPEPSKFNHLGHSVSFLINYLYAKKYDGKVLLRFDDTNPEKSTQEYVDAMKRDIIEYMGLNPEEIKFASDHMDNYYSYAQKLIDEGNAYICFCEKETMSTSRRTMESCAHRETSVEENQKLWQEMKDGKFEDGTAVLRLKIDMEHKNAVMRDPVIYRLCSTPHYSKGTTYRVWPMYDFECAIEEGLCNITHVFRTNEFDSRIELQNYIANLFGFPDVTYKHYGRVSITGATTKGREIRELIKSGNYTGWDDPRLVTLTALRRRGIVRESYYELAQKVGMSKTQTVLDFSTIASINRGILDSSAKRFYGITNPVKITVNNMPEDFKTINLKYHPTLDRHERMLHLTNNFFIEKSDFDKVNDGATLRLMDCMNIKKISDTTFEFQGLNHDDYKRSSNKGGLIHYVPCNGLEVECDIFMPDATTKTILTEENISTIKPNDVIQFERFAFVRLDRVDNNKPVFWYSHE